MLDSLLDGLKGQVAGAIAEKAGIDLGQAEQAVPLAGESIKEGIMGAVSEGNAGDIMGMFSGLAGGGSESGGGGALGALAGLAGGNSGGGGALGALAGLAGGGGGAGDLMKNAVFSSISGNFVGKLTSQLGLPSGIASTISTMALPMIMNKIKGSASNESGEMDAAGLMNTLGVDAGAMGGLGSLLGGLGGDAGAEGGVADALKDKAIDAVKDKLGGLGNLLG